MFEKSLSDLIKGLRSNKKDEAKYIAGVVDEIRHEVKSGDMEVKAGAVLKLTYLQMLGYDMSWAAFHIVEVMASPRYHLKHIGYLAAAQSFRQDTDVLMLTTNLLRKDLASNPLDVALTLNGVSSIFTPDLARDLSPDIVAMLNHSRPAIRKRAVLVLYHVIRRWPDTLEPAFERLREKLEDPDLGVASASVNILLELARRDPRPYLPLAPQLFQLLTTSTNNWMLIKIIKLFGVLTPFEPRLVRKLLPPITTIISTTPAMSLLYECIHTVIIGGMLTGPTGDSLAQSCVDKLATFLEDQDQNLKFISLVSLTKILPTHAHLVAEHQENIFSSMDDPDLSIRMRALDLVSGMVTRRNLYQIVQQLMAHLQPPTYSSASAGAGAATASLSAALSSASGASASAAATAAASTSSPSYRLTVVKRILTLCAADTYSNVMNFEWYLSVLVELAYISGVEVGTELRDQIVDICARVRAVRSFAVARMARLLGDQAFVEGAGKEGGNGDVLRAAAWVVGEYCSELQHPPSVLPSLLQPAIATLSPDTVVVCLHNAVKMFSFWAGEVAERWEEDALEEVKSVADLVLAGLEPFLVNPHIELQERAGNLHQLFRLLRRDLDAPRPQLPAPLPASMDDPASAAFMEDAARPSEAPTAPRGLSLLSPLFFIHELGPVAERAQSKVTVPEGLDLDAWIVDPAGELSVVCGDSDVEADEVTATIGYGGSEGSKRRKGKGRAKEGDVYGLSIGIGYEEEDARAMEEDEQKARELREKQRVERLERMREDPYYLGPSDGAAAPALQPPTTARAATPSGAGTPSGAEEDEDDVDSIPIVKIDFDMPSFNLTRSGSPSQARALTSSAAPPVVEVEGEMPEEVKKVKRKSKPKVAKVAGADGNDAGSDGTNGAGPKKVKKKVKDKDKEKAGKKKKSREVAVS